MPELERELRALAADVIWPETPPLPVRAPLRARPWRLALALAVAAAALAAAFAVPPARTALLRLFHLGGAAVVRVDELPRVPTTGELDLGRRTSAAGAERAAGFRLRYPDLGDPDSIHVRRSGAVSLVYGGGRLVLTEARGEVFWKKTAGAARPVSVGGSPGLWVPGPHFFAWLSPSGTTRAEPPYLAGSTLIWQRGGLTFRLEGAVTVEQALDVARSVRRR